MRPVVPQGSMLRAAIVPECHGVRSPSKAALEERVLQMLIEIAQHGLLSVTECGQIDPSFSVYLYPLPREAVGKGAPEGRSNRSGAKNRLATELSFDPRVRRPPMAGA